MLLGRAVMPLGRAVMALTVLLGRASQVWLLACRRRVNDGKATHRHHVSHDRNISRVNIRAVPCCVRSCPCGGCWAAGQGRAVTASTVLLSRASTVLLGRACKRRVNDGRAMHRHHVCHDRNINRVNIRAVPCRGCSWPWGSSCWAAERGRVVLGRAQLGLRGSASRTVFSPITSSGGDGARLTEYYRLFQATVS